MVTTTHIKNQPDLPGFSLVELLIAIVIVGILGSIALPQYFNQVQKTRQNEAAASLSQIQTTIAAFADEIGILPVSWSDLNKITPLMTPKGPANQSNFDWISLASTGCTKTLKEHCYKVNISENNQIYTLQAKPANSDAKNYNVVACLDLRTGSSDLKKGTNSKAVETEDLQCMSGET